MSTDTKGRSMNHASIPKRVGLVALLAMTLTLLAASVALAAVVKGTAGDDNLSGTSGADTMQGNPGQDYMSGGVDNDRVVGGQGPDTIYGPAGNDFLSGGPRVTGSSRPTTGSATRSRAGRASTGPASASTTSSTASW